MIVASISGITYIYWAALYMHLFSAVAWLGGILFLTGVSRPIVEYYGTEAINLSQRIKIRFLGFTWMLLWTVLVTGIIILLWSTRFIFFDFSTLWRVLAHIKIILFLVLASLSLTLRTSYKEMENARSEKEINEDLSPRDIILWRIRMIEQVEVWMAIFILLVVSLMQVY
jgi:putative copper export protein